MKAALVSADIDPPYTHDIEALWHLLPRQFPDRDRLGTLIVFTPYAHGFRYPTREDPPKKPSLQDIERWVDQITEIKIDFERGLEQQADVGRGDG